MLALYARKRVQVKSQLAIELDLLLALVQAQKAAQQAGLAAAADVYAGTQEKKISANKEA